MPFGGMTYSVSGEKVAVGHHATKVRSTGVKAECGKWWVVPPVDYPLKKGEGDETNQTALDGETRK